MSTVLLPMKRPVRPPPPVVVVGGADELVLSLGVWPGGTLPPFAAVLLPDMWPVGPEVLPPFAVGMPAVLLDAPGTGPPPSLVPAMPVVPAVVLDAVATACR